MSNEVYANSRAVSCKAGASKSVCAFPDVCMTPPQTPATPPGVPVPYPNTGFSSDTSDGSTSVMISGEEVMLKSTSFFKSSSGDEAGCAPKKGVVNSKNTGKVFFTSWSMDVLFEGENVDRHLDLTTHNHGSTANEALTWPNIEKPSLKGLKTKPCNKNCPKDVSQAEYEELRDATPSQTMRDKVNARKYPRYCVVCGDRKRRLSVDHIVPLNEIRSIPGFACLGPKTKRKIINHPDNFVGMCRSCNSSKQDKLWGEWLIHLRRDMKIPKKVTNKGKAVAKLSRMVLVKEIRKGTCNGE
ncbi:MULTISPECIES: PAAR-like domain-containing protein [unclassified Caballeronia]|uniref:PAAR-like domain-containing protein n=1 Tax=unclassified Caballeronia TaxID=2646786 RepID=UPI002865794E|nr:MULTISPECIES: PAAR-like domain-containing protein [unclassified Caballeronia]MDR5753763.1 DUF4150 domain-containing protein [Caballeronia sp. LZ024]MDR5840142.1 DUF4150 domain-containing protein [Caballeronia sp. LZ031]